MGPFVCRFCNPLEKTHCLFFGIIASMWRLITSIVFCSLSLGLNSQTSVPASAMPVCSMWETVGVSCVNDFFFVIVHYCHLTFYNDTFYRIYCLNNITLYSLTLREITIEPIVAIIAVVTMTTTARSTNKFE